MYPWAWVMCVLEHAARVGWHLMRNLVRERLQAAGFVKEDEFCPCLLRGPHEGFEQHLLHEARYVHGDPSDSVGMSLAPAQQPEWAEKKPQQNPGSWHGVANR